MLSEFKGGDATAVVPLRQARIEIVSQAIGRLIAIVGIFGHELVHDGHQHGGHVGIVFADRGGLTSQVGVHPAQGVTGLKGQVAGEHLVERNPQGVKIRAVINGAAHAPGLFGRHVGQGAFELFGGAEMGGFEVELGGNAKVDDRGTQGLGINNDIVRVEVFMNNVGLVESVEALSDRDREGEEIF